MQWDIRREGKSWSREEIEEKYLSPQFPEKLELVEGKLLWTQEERLHLLACLLEHVGVDAALGLGNPQVWKQAISDLEAGGRER